MLRGCESAARVPWMSGVRCVACGLPCRRCTQENVWLHAHAAQVQARLECLETEARVREAATGARLQLVENDMATASGRLEVLSKSVKGAIEKLDAYARRANGQGDLQIYEVLAQLKAGVSSTDALRAELSQAQVLLGILQQDVAKLKSGMAVQPFQTIALGDQVVDYLLQP